MERWSVYLKIAAVGGHKLLLVLAFLSVEHHPSQTFIEVSIIEGKVMPSQLPVDTKS